MRKRWGVPAVSLAATIGAVVGLPLPALGAAVVSLGGIIGLVLAICFATAVLEARCYLRCMGAVARPMVRFARLPEMCAQAFLTSFASGSVAAMMLAEEYKSGRLGRREMILGALCNSVPPIFMFNCYLTVPMFGMIGWIGVWYFLLSGGILVSALLLFLTAARIGMRSRTGAAPAEVCPAPMTWGDTLRTAWKKTGKFLVRLLLLTTPFYLWTACALRKGWLDFSLPPGFQDFLSQEALAVIAARVGGLLAAAGTAAELLRRQEISPGQLLLALMVGNVLNGFTRMLRRGLPVAMGIYPGGDGALIAIVSTGTRIILTAGVVLVLWRAGL